MGSPSRTQAAQDTIARGLSALGAKLSAAGLDRDTIDAGQRELGLLVERLRQLAAAAAPVGADLANRAIATARPLRDQLVERLADNAERIAKGAKPLRDEMMGRLAGRAAAGTLVTQGLRAVSRNRAGIVTAAAAVAGIAAVGMLARRHRARADADLDTEAPAVASITINRPQGEVYRFWRDLQNVPKFMDRIASVRETDHRRSHWVAKAPAGTTLEWDAEITEDERDERIAWRSLEGSDVETHGSVRFSPAAGGRGTAVRVELFYRPPGGAIGALVAKLFGELPEEQLRADLRRLAQLLETGEIATNARRAT
jgi:uncharacterized membrane protein